MGKPIQDDYNGELLDAETDKVYTLSVTTRPEDKNGNKHFIKAEFDLSHRSVMELVLSKFEPKKIAWKEWLRPTDEEQAEAEAKGKKAYGQWKTYNGTI